MTIEHTADPLETAAAATKRKPLIALDGVCKYSPLPWSEPSRAPAEFAWISRRRIRCHHGAVRSGKSTLMNILGCLDRCTEGHYRIEGQDVSDLDRDQLARMRRSMFGFVFQSYNLIPSATALENVEMPAVYAGSPPAVRHERAKRLLASVGLEDRLNHQPNQLSGGEQQRTAIARAMMNSGRVVLADEPTGALDSATGLRLMEFLESSSTQGHTIIIITHDRSVASHAHRIVELRDGRILPTREPTSSPGFPSLRDRALSKDRPFTKGRGALSMR